MALIGEAAQVGDIRDRKRRIEKQLAGTLDATIQKPAMRRQARGFLR
jgi:hypothetical protein